MKFVLDHPEGKEPLLKLAVVANDNEGFTVPENETDGLVQEVELTLPGVAENETPCEKPVTCCSNIRSKANAAALALPLFIVSWLIPAGVIRFSVCNVTCTRWFMFALKFDEKISLGSCGRRRLCKTEQPSVKTQEGITLFLEKRWRSIALRGRIFPEI